MNSFLGLLRNLREILYNNLYNLRRERERERERERLSMGQYCNTAAAPELGCYDNTLKRFHLSVSHQVRDCEIDTHFHFTSIIAFPVVQCKINAEQQMTGARQVPVTATTAAEEADCQGSSNCGEY